jgi:hypothetical protein
MSKSENTYAVASVFEKSVACDQILLRGCF